MAASDSSAEVRARAVSRRAGRQEKRDRRSSSGPRGPEPPRRLHRCRRDEEAGGRCFRQGAWRPSPGRGSPGQGHRHPQARLHGGRGAPVPSSRTPPRGTPMKRPGTGPGKIPCRGPSLCEVHASSLGRGSPPVVLVSKIRDSHRSSCSGHCEGAERPRKSPSSLSSSSPAKGGFGIPGSESIPAPERFPFIGF